MAEAHHDFGPADHRDGVQRVEGGTRDQRRHDADMAVPVAVRHDPPSPRCRCRAAAATVRARGGTGCRPDCACHKAGRSGHSGRARRAGDRAPGAAARGRARRPRPPRRDPAASAIGQPMPNGPRSPTVSPGESRVSAAETGPTARIVWIRRSGSAGSPLRLIGTSPTPNTVSMLNWPGAKARLNLLHLDLERPDLRSHRAGGGARGRSAAPSDRRSGRCQSRVRHGRHRHRESAAASPAAARSGRA